LLAKNTSKNRLTLPKEITNAIGPAEYFEIEIEGGRTILTPDRLLHAEALQAKPAEFDLNDEDIADAVAWTRESRRGVWAPLATSDLGFHGLQPVLILRVLAVPPSRPCRKEVPIHGVAADQDQALGIHLAKMAM